ncbi:hypothetical protein [Sporomusa termitida]|uniref:Uncharacterized protein n=1 Tax=Sporomusa termitida TaxID=2377 RepID=A0A517DXA7_9FIRM|nr:hypothetical protein [Sporomusa termitida]QDR81990.1 hypothetical protein SPTER_34110 [Sporomusa termitida]
MSEERFDRMEQMMAQLITMVGHNNAVTEELRQDVTGLKQDVAGLKQDVAVLKQDIVTLAGKLEKGFADIVHMIHVLGDKADKIELVQAHHSDVLDVLAIRTTRQEAEIQALKRAM